MPVQAEAHARHVQLGRVAPGWLGLTGADRVAAGTSGWQDMKVSNVRRDDTVYNFQRPGEYGFKVNTNANH